MGERAVSVEPGEGALWPCRWSACASEEVERRFFPKCFFVPDEGIGAGSPEELARRIGRSDVVRRLGEAPAVYVVAAYVQAPADARERIAVRPLVIELRAR